jgi:hypothetical protein
MHQNLILGFPEEVRNLLKRHIRPQVLSNLRTYSSSNRRISERATGLQMAYSSPVGRIPDVLGKFMVATTIDLRKVITKLDDVKIELLRLRAALLPEERVPAAERKLIEQGQREIERGRYVTLGQLRKELGA